MSYNTNADPAEVGEVEAWCSTQIMETIQPWIDSQTDRGDGPTAELDGDTTDSLAHEIVEHVLAKFRPDLVLSSELEVSVPLGPCDDCGELVMSGTEHDTSNGSGEVVHAGECFDAHNQGCSMCPIGG